MSCKVQPIQIINTTNKRDGYTLLSLPQGEIENTSFEWNIFKFFKHRKNPHTQNGEEFKSPLSIRTRILILVFGFFFLAIIFYIEYSQTFRYRSY